MVNNNYLIGIDVGATVCKAVVLLEDQKEIIAKIKALVHGNPEKASMFCLRELSKNLKIKKNVLKKNSVATGQNGDKISIENKQSEVICIGKGAYSLNSETRIVVDVGSFSMKAVKIDEKGKIKDFLMNNKCASGAGILLELVGEGLELDVSEIAEIAAKAKDPIQISSQCSIFAESEVISYKNEGANIPDLVAGVCNSIAGRIYPLIRKLDKKPNGVTLTGGVALNGRIVKNLEERLNLQLLKLPINPQYITAYGAAIIAKEKVGGF
ncbi:MAG: acyl-CoA dehydratase activase [Promethearchaeota archaeon]